MLEVVLLMAPAAMALRAGVLLDVDVELRADVDDEKERDRLM